MTDEQREVRIDALRWQLVIAHNSGNITKARQVWHELRDAINHRSEAQVAKMEAQFV